MEQRWHVAIWPDGTWAWREDMHLMTHMSDDFIRIALPEWVDEESVDRIAELVELYDWRIREIELHFLRYSNGPEAQLPDNWQPPKYS